MLPTRYNKKLKIIIILNFKNKKWRRLLLSKVQNSKVKHLNGLGPGSLPWIPNIVLDEIHQFVKLKIRDFEKSRIVIFKNTFKYMIVRNYILRQFGILETTSHWNCFSKKEWNNFKYSKNDHFSKIHQNNVQKNTSYLAKMIEFIFENLLKEKINFLIFEK